MGRQDNIRLTRRDMLKLGAGGAGMFMISAGGLAIPKGFAGGGGGGGGSLYIEAFPTSPLILKPFNDPLAIPAALRPKDPTTWDSAGGLPDPMHQDSIGPSPTNAYYKKYGQTLGQHQLWPGDGPTALSPSSTFKWLSTTPLVYQLKVQAAAHSFTSSMVQPINSFGKNVTPPGAANASPRYLPKSTIWGFNARDRQDAGEQVFPGPRINAEYGRASLVRFENHLQPENDDGNDPMDFGSPSRTFLTHLHNGHTAPESDGQPHYSYYRFAPYNRFTHDAAWKPGEWVDQLYLGYPAGGAEREKQSFFWFHDHVHGHTGANVYKGMVGLMPIYDPVMDNGDERTGYRLPGARTDYADGSFDVDYDIPMALYDCRMDDGVTPHKDAHNGHGETHPEWWGKTYFRHFPNHGFVGDVFTVNGTAYPVLEVKRRKYRLRFLDASISRIYNLQLMTGHPKAARDLGYTGDELQGQYRLPDGQQCMKWVQIANEGGLLPQAIIRDSFELWPAKRREFVVDFSRYQDGTPTKPGDEIYLVDTMKMTTGRMWDQSDPAYKVPLMKIVIGDVAPDYSLPGVDVLKPGDMAKIQLREVPDMVPGAVAAIKDKSIPTFELQRGSSNADPETEWLINGQQFEPDKPLIGVPKDSAGVWRIRNGGGGWVHPFHLHMEEHRVVSRNGKLAADARHPDDTGKEDVVALDPSEEVVISRRFRTFTGPYVAHCHNLAHEDHNMMFGWEILPNSSI
jgi:FtsP/CotA-like multicopper oxidase with cupredoxin domain